MYWLSRKRNGFDTFGLPSLEKLLMVKRGIAALQRVGAVGAGNLQNVEPVVLVDIDILRAEPLARDSRALPSTRTRGDTV